LRLLSGRLLWTDRTHLHAAQRVRHVLYFFGEPDSDLIRAFDPFAQLSCVFTAVAFTSSAKRRPFFEIFLLVTDPLSGAKSTPRTAPVPIAISVPTRIFARTHRGIPFFMI